MPLGASFKIDEKTRVVYLNKIVQRPCMRPRNHYHTNAAHCVASRDPPPLRASPHRAERAGTDEARRGAGATARRRTRRV